MANGILLATRVRQQREQEQRGLGRDIVALQQFIQNRQQSARAEQLLSNLQSLPPEQRQQFQGQPPQFPAFTQFPTPQSTAGGELFSKFLLGQQREQGAQGFTLSPGQQRFGPGGQPIAAAPAKDPTALQQIQQKKLSAINALQERDKVGDLLPAEKEALDKAVLGGGGINIDFSKGQLISAATSLRKEFNTDQRVKDFRILAPKFKNMLSFLERSKKTGQKGPTDIALSKTFQKLTDLMSSVREGEYETTFRGQALLQKLRGGIQKLTQGGEGITPEFRQELVDTARLMFEDGKLFFNQAIEEKGTVADAFGIPRPQILGNIKPFDIVNTENEFQDIFGAAGGNVVQPTGRTATRRTRTATRTRRTALRQQLQGGEILVIEKSTGQIGALPENEFDPNNFERVK